MRRSYVGFTREEEEAENALSKPLSAFSTSSSSLPFPDFDLAPKRNKKFGYCGLDLV